MPKMTGSQAFADLVEGYGLSHVFNMPTMMMPAMAELDRRGIVPITPHSEKAAAYMADGFARASHRPGICMAQNVGAANLAAGLKDAELACAPVIAITGGAVPADRYRNTYQETEDLGMFDAVTRFNAYLDRPEALPRIFRQLVRASVAGHPGPVHLRVPGTSGQTLNSEFEFVDVFPDLTCTSVPPFRPEPEPEKLREAIALLRSAERPVIIAGGGVMWSGAAEELVALAERLDLPVATALHAKAAIPDNHPLNVGVPGTYSRACANRTLAQADLVFFVGSRSGSQVTNGWKLPPAGTPAIQLDLDPVEIGRNYACKVGLMGDVKASLRRLLEIAQPAPARDAWRQTYRKLVDDWKDQHAAVMRSDDVPIRPERICREIGQALPENSIVVSDTGHSGMWTGQMLELNQRSQGYIRCAGSLGWALPASIGVKLGAPNRPVVCFTGDGGALYHLTELETAARYGIPVVFVINDNHSLNQETRGVAAAYGDNRPQTSKDMWIFKEVDYVKVAEAMGCEGMRVERPNDLAGALSKAFASNRPFLLDVVSDINALAPTAWSA
ncbi:MAG: thiamine pyrophosphate-binding protein [Chloroflexi bacterium]|nr:thiamine pyrophosphate-binding protein [Chloroflexota bacterium]